MRFGARIGEEAFEIEPGERLPLCARFAELPEKERPRDLTLPLEGVGRPSLETLDRRKASENTYSVSF
jgi:hypothetical protein